MRKQTIFVFDDAWKDYQKGFAALSEIISTILGTEVSFVGFPFDEGKPLSIQIAEAIDAALGVRDGCVDVTAILMDILFQTPDDTYNCFDPLQDSDVHGQSLLDEVVGSGLPVIMFTSSQQFTHVHSAGRMNLSWIEKDLFLEDKLQAFAGKLAPILKHEIEYLKFNETTLLVENDFAPHYDGEELGSLATRAVVLWENERILTAVRAAAQTLNRKLQILDIGCGTGRFEEVLLSHTDTKDCIRQIVAVDFAPRYLVCARERLAGLGLGTAMERHVVFRRRIAEDLRLPSSYFDVVLVAFGVPCFSRYQKSIAEAARILRSGGTAVLTGYNYDSLNFEYEENVSERVAGIRRSFFCANIDRKNNLMTLPGQQPFTCHTFTPQYFLEVVRQHLFVAEAPDCTAGMPFEPSETFPVLYGCTARQYIESLVDVRPTSDGPNIHSYMPAAIENLPGFSRELYRIDRDLCRLSALRLRGHYINIIASKR